MLELRLLGQFEACLDGTQVVLPSRPAQSLLAYLALNAGTAHRREKLAGLLWPDTDDDNARSNLRHALWRIRKAVEVKPDASPYLLTDDLAVAFNTGSDYWLDTAVLSRDGDSVQSLIDSLSVYRGDLLPGFYHDWVTRERERLEAVFEHQMQRLLDRLVEGHRWPEVLEWAERWLALGHAPEPGYRALMLAHAELGDRSRVAAVYQRCREALFNELGVEPSFQTMRLYERLARSQEPTTALSGQSQPDPHVADHIAPVAGDPPYLGLHYFDEVDADWFFGRESLTARLVARVRTESVLAIVGASGSGKSSLVRAGLIPALTCAGPLDGSPRAGGAPWNIRALTTPTDHPLDALTESLIGRDGTESGVGRRALLDELSRDPHGLRRYLERTAPRGQRVVLVIDQFEELFTLCHDAFEREAFVDHLLGAAEADGPAAVVIVLRADFYAHCALYPALRDAVARHQEYVGPLTAGQLRRAIEGPAERGGWEIEPGLVDLLLRDVGEEPGALPLVAHSLLETWQRRQGRRLTLAGYAAAGGVHGAIAQTAETVFGQRLTRAQQHIARRIFLHLTELGEGTQDTRRRANVSEFVQRPEEEPEVHAVLQVLANARLVTLGQGTAEVAHEALIREWPALRDWLNQDRQHLRLHRQLADSAREWERLERDPGLVYRGARLAQVGEWAAEHDGELHPQEQAFLDASRALVEGEAAEREAQRQRALDAAQRVAETERQRATEQSRAAAQLRLRAVYLTGALVLALAMAGTAVFFGEQARRSALAAQANARAASWRELAASALANLDVDPERSILLALQAVAVTDSAPSETRTPEAENALHLAVQASRTQLTLRGHTDRVNGVAFSSDGGRLVTASADRTVKVWNAATGAEVLTLAGHADEVLKASFSPDGTRLATASADHTAKVWDAVSGSELLTLVGHSDELRSVAFSPDGQRLATASLDGTARIWDMATGQELLRLSGHTRGVLRLAYSPDGTRLATTGLDGTARVWDTTTGQNLLTLTGHIGEVAAVSFSPDGSRLATGGGADLTVRLWDAVTGQELHTLSHQECYIESVNFSPDGSRLATATYCGAALVFDTSTGKEMFRLYGHSTAVFQIAFSPDGTRLATAGADKTARVWDAMPSGNELLTLAGHTATVFDVKFSPDGSRLATASWDGTARLWDAANGKLLRVLAGHTDQVYQIAFSPDGTRLATASADNTVKVWDATTGQERLTISGHGQPLGVAQLVGSVQFTGVLDVSFSPDGTRLATGGADGTVRLWDASTGSELLVLRGHRARVNAIAFSPDGTRLATGSDDRTAKIWDLSTGQELLTLSGHTLRVWRVPFSPDGTRLATSGSDATVKVWDTVTWQELLTLRGQPGSIQTTFSPDGTRLITPASDGTIKVWDAVTGRELLMLNFPGGGVTRTAVSPDGSRLAAASTNNLVHVYLLRLDDLVALAHARLTRSWTPEECQHFLHLDRCPS